MFEVTSLLIPHRIMRLLSLLLAALSQTSAISYPLLPPLLFSPLITQKLLSDAQLMPGVPTSYPQYTTPDTGVWRYFGADNWTSGFLPATFYALAERASICPCALNGTTTTQWLEIGRSSATGEIPLEVYTSVGHDVGFLSFPFVDELTMYAAPLSPPRTLDISLFLCLVSSCTHARARTPHTLETRKTKQPYRPSRCLPLHSPHASAPSSVARVAGTPRTRTTSR